MRRKERPGRVLKVLPYMIQLVLVLMSMYQALILTMLGRWVFIAMNEPISVLLMIALMWGPTLLMSQQMYHVSTSGSCPASAEDI